MRLTVITPTADVIGNPQEPHRISNKDSQLLYGEQFIVEESHGAYVYGHCAHDGYKGYLEREQLAKNIPAGDALVTVKAAHLYPVPDFKSRPLMTLDFLSRMDLTGETENGFTKTHDGAWIFTAHTNKLSGQNKSLVDLAMIYLGTPYRFGGRSVQGIDCSGLIQNIMIAAGYDSPRRDSKDQADSFGKPVKTKEISRGDIVFFDGHVGIMIGSDMILNATARHMTTLIEPLADLITVYGKIRYIARVR